MRLPPSDFECKDTTINRYNQIYSLLHGNSEINASAYVEPCFISHSEIEVEAEVFRYRHDEGNEATIHQVTILVIDEPSILTHIDQITCVADIRLTHQGSEEEIFTYHETCTDIP